MNVIKFEAALLRMGLSEEEVREMLPVFLGRGGIRNDVWIREMAQNHGMIEPYFDGLCEDGVISYGQASYGYDIRASRSWRLFTNVHGVTIDPKNFDPGCLHPKEISETIGNYVLIPPNSYALTASYEYIRMPRDTMGLCVGKSTYARCGIHVNVTPIEPEWEGNITIEISNSTSLPVKVYPEEGIMQLLFLGGEPPKVSYKDRQGKYQGQKGVTPARIRRGKPPEANPVQPKGLDPRVLPACG